MAVAVVGPHEVARVAGLGALLLVAGCITINVTPASDDDDDGGTTGAPADPGPGAGSDGMPGDTEPAASSDFTTSTSTTGAMPSSTGESSTSSSTTTSGESSESATSDASSSSSSDDGAASESSTGGGGGPAVCGDGVVDSSMLCFAAPFALSTGPSEFPTGRVFADFDDDGQDDYVQGTRRTGQLSRLAGIDVFTGDPTTGLIHASTHQLDVPPNLGGVHPRSMYAEDFDGDGRMDLAFIEDRGVVLGFHPHLRIWTSLGTTHFNETFVHPFEPLTTVDLRTGEFTGDGLPDVLTYDAAGVQVWPGIGGGQLGMPLPPAPPLAPGTILAETFDGDALTDLYLRSGGTASIWLGQAGGSFVETAAPGCSGVMWARDLDGDDIVDLVCRDGDTVETHFGVGDATFDPVVVANFPAESGAYAALGDVDGDGILDLLWTEVVSVSSFEVYVARGEGGGGYGPAELLSGDFGSMTAWPSDLWAHDVNGDGVDDVFGVDVTDGNHHAVYLLLSDP